MATIDQPCAWGSSVCQGQRFSDDCVQLAKSAQRVSTDGLRWADQDLATMADGDDDDDDQP